MSAMISPEIVRLWIYAATVGLGTVLLTSGLPGCGEGEQSSRNEPPAPAGNIVEGIRVMNVGAAGPLGDVTVYRGETVRLVIAPQPHARRIRVPQYEVDITGEAGQSLEIQFKAKDEGRFPVLLGSQEGGAADEPYGKIVVIPFAGTGDAKFAELTAREASVLIEEHDPLILDVRTESEFRGGHIENALLIPVQSLANRLDELGDARDRKILIYCRSGNRSTVAGEILMRNGFTDLYNLRHGIREWGREGLPITR